MNFAEMTSDELDNIYQKMADDSRSIMTELNNRKEAEKQNRIQEVKNSPEFEKLVEKFRQAKKRAKAASGKHTISLMLPVNFTLVQEFALDGTFERYVLGKILNGKGFNRVQKEILQMGLDGAIESACDDIYRLFPEKIKVQDAILKDIVGLHMELKKLNVPFSYVEAQM